MMYLGNHIMVSEDWLTTVITVIFGIFIYRTSVKSYYPGRYKNRFLRVLDDYMNSKLVLRGVQACIIFLAIVAVLTIPESIRYDSVGR